MMMQACHFLQWTAVARSLEQQKHQQKPAMHDRNIVVISLWMSHEYFPCSKAKQSSALEIVLPKD
jgi:hypothetical protein